MKRTVTAELKAPIFLIGNVRSGTTMMFDLFDHHPAVVGWYEPRTVWTFAAPGRRHDRFTAEDARARVVRYVRRRFEKYQIAHGNLRVMEKTPSNIMRISYVGRIFPEAKFLYMIREPLANLSSSELKWRVSINRHQFVRRLTETPKTQLHYYAWRLVQDKARKLLGRKHVSIWGVRYRGIHDDLKRFSVEEIISKQWIACARQADADFAEVDPALVLRVRYEDFVADPVAGFERICDHFDLPLPDHLAAYVRDSVDPSRQEKWRRLEPKVIERCLPILREEMVRQGYEIPEEYGELAES